MCSIFITVILCFKGSTAVCPPQQSLLARPDHTQMPIRTNECASIDLPPAVPPRRKQRKVCIYLT